jgi:hypothetical protein
MATPNVSEATIDQVCERFAAIEPAEAQRAAARMGPFQPELTAFVIASTSALSQKAIELGMYATLILYEAFRVSHFKVHKARERLVVRQWEAASELVADLRDSGWRPTDRAELDVDTAEPHALGYVIDALTYDTPDDSVNLTDDEFWQLFAVLKAVVETLHEVAGAPRFVRSGAGEVTP